jgi:hypothetical protein
MVIVQNSDHQDKSCLETSMQCIECDETMNGKLWNSTIDLVLSLILDSPESSVSSCPQSSSAYHIRPPRKPRSRRLTKATGMANMS